MSPAVKADRTPSAVLRAQRAAANRDKWEVPFLIQVRTLKLPEPIRNYRFAAHHLGWDVAGNNPAAARFRPLLLAAGLKDWKMDFAWPSYYLAVEIEGAPGHGRHTSAPGFTGDCVKYGEAKVLGWDVLRVTGQQVKSGYAINLTYRVFKGRAIAEFQPR